VGARINTATKHIRLMPARSITSVLTTSFARSGSRAARRKPMASRPKTARRRSGSIQATALVSTP
jgi:hypothetical protein